MTSVAEAAKDHWLFSDSPRRLLDRPLKDYKDHLNSTDELEVVDYVVRNKTRLALLSGNIKAMARLCNEISTLVPVNRETELFEYHCRWRSLEDLLHSQIAILREENARSQQKTETKTP